MGFVLIILGLGAIVFFATVRNQTRRTALRCATTDLEIDEFGARREMADGRREEVEWIEVSEVEVLTAATGPYKANGGVVILAGTPERGCLVPLDNVGPSGLLEQLTRLPGFDVNLFAEALQTKPPTRTMCWRRGS